MAWLFEQTVWFWLLVAVGVLVLLFLYNRVWQSRMLSRFGSRQALSRHLDGRSAFKPYVTFVMLVLALCLLVISIVNIKYGERSKTVTREGVDIVFAIDVSKSMLAEDVAPNRLARAKQLVRQIVDNLESDRIGIIAYAGSAFPQLPITTDYNAASLFLNNINTDMLSSQGTAISEAIDLSTTYYQDIDQKNRVLIILSDGEDHDGSIEMALEKAKDEGIRIYTIGLGTEEGGLIPIKNNNGRLLNYKKDNNGKNVITKRNAETLRQIAQDAGGAYIDGTVTQTVLNEMDIALTGMDRKQFEAQQIQDLDDQYQWPAGIAFALLVLQIFVLERSTWWLKKLRILD